VVLAHAIGTSLRMWDPQIDALASDYRVVRYDHRGHGRSPVTRGPYSIDDLGWDLIRLLDRLDIERAAICGLSLGAMVALWAAAHAPDRIDRVVACSAVTRPASPAGWLDRAAAVRRGGVAAIGDLVVERWGYTGRDHRIEALVREMLAATPDEGYAGCCEAMARLDLEGDLPRISAPALIVAGADDPAASVDEARRIAAAVVKGKVAVVDGAAHLANVERAPAINALISQHLAAFLAEATT